MVFVTGTFVLTVFVLYFLATKDVMSLIGANCIGNFNYYLSFTIMVLLPVGILLMACLSHCGSSRVLAKQLAAMTVDEKAKQTKQALNALFELADSDHSGHVEPKELAEI